MQAPLELLKYNRLTRWIACEVHGSTWLHLHKLRYFITLMWQYEFRFGCYDATTITQLTSLAEKRLSRAPCSLRV